MPIQSRIAAVPKKEALITFKAVTIPENSLNVLSTFESNSQVKSGTANEWTIDVFPDQYPLMCYIMKLAAAASSRADHKDQSKSSLATVCFYYAAVLQGFLLLSDMHVRPTPSSHAQSWHNTHYKAQFAEWLLSLPVPDEMLPLLAQLSASQTDKTKNVFYVPSAAGFDLDHFFGRFVPLNFFASIHDTIATQPGNSKPSEIYQDLFARTLFTIPSSRDKTRFTIPDILGFTTNATTATTANHPTTKWHQCFTAIFNPVLFRDFHRRSSLAPLNMTEVEFTKKENINAYDILFAATPYNLRESKIVLQHVVTVLDGTINAKKTLSEVLREQSGIQILMHGYSTYALPTWTSNDDTMSTALESITKIAPITAAKRATEILFLQQEAPRTATHQITSANADDNTGLTTPSPWSLIQAGAATLFPDTKDQVVFNDETHTYPKVLVLDPFGDNKMNAHLALLAGKIIETFELDGTVISLPNCNKPLSMQNCNFFDSAVPFQYVARSTSFRPRTTGVSPTLARRLPKASTSLQASSIMHDRNTINIPYVATGSAATVGISNIIDNPTPNLFAGLTVKYTNWIKYTQSFFGFTSKISTATDTADTVAGMEKGRLYVWSPYTYTSYTDQSMETTNPDLHQGRSYFLTNLRTIFGTDSPLYEVVHPMEAMPV